MLGGQTTRAKIDFLQSYHASVYQGNHPKCSIWARGLEERTTMGFGPFIAQLKMKLKASTQYQFCVKLWAKRREQQDGDEREKRRNETHTKPNLLLRHSEARLRQPRPHARPNLRKRRRLPRRLPYRPRAPSGRGRPPPHPWRALRRVTPRPRPHRRA